MKKKLVSIILVAGMIAGLCAGCGGTENAASDGAAATDASATAEDATEEDAATEAENLDFGGAELKIMMPNTGCIIDGNDRVVEKINEITSEKLNLTVSVEWVGLGDYQQQTNLLFSSQEAYDLIMCTPLNSYASMVGQDELMDISDYLDEYGQDILASTGYMDAYTSGDAIYGIPVNREKAGAYWIFMRTDILEELGLVEQAEAITTWDDYYAILDQVNAAHPELNAVYYCANNNVGTFLDAAVDTSPDNFADGKALDNLGDAYNLVYVDDNGNVASYYESEAFQNGIARSKEIYDMGYVNTDCTTNSDDAVVACKNQTCFSWIAGGESDAEQAAELNSGMDLTCVNICPETASTYLVTMWGFTVPYTSENPDAAVAFMNLMYTDSELANLFTWGEEGVDWETNEDGFAQYVEGTDCGYHNMIWQVGNALIVTPWDGNASLEEQAEIVANEEKSQYLGFLADTSDLEQTITACVNVVNEYRNQLYVGAAGDATDSLYAEMCEKLQAAGINDVVAAYQEQLDAWLAEK